MGLDEIIPQATINKDKIVSRTSGGCKALRKSPDGLSSSNAKNVVGYEQIPSKGQKDHITHGQRKCPNKSSQKVTPESNQQVLARQSPCLFEEAHIEDHVACPHIQMVFSGLAAALLMGQSLQ
jgi:hypothetical protein